jgi:pimeloyl-ACP methyl ester carboxylesterase
MIHGFPDYWYTWRDQMEALADNYRVVAVVQRDYNQSDAPEGVESYALSALVGGAATFNDEAGNRSYRLQYGTINTMTDIGWSIDSVLAGHAFFGTTAVVQTGPVMTIPATDIFYV